MKVLWTMYLNSSLSPKNLELHQRWICRRKKFWGFWPGKSQVSVIKQGLLARTLTCGFVKKGNQLLNKRALESRRFFTSRRSILSTSMNHFETVFRRKSKVLKSVTRDRKKFFFFKKVVLDFSAECFLFFLEFFFAFKSNRKSLFLE